MILHEQTAVPHVSSHPVRKAFLRWQCRVRQIAMREQMGRPDDAVMPAVTLAGEDQSIGHIVTVLSKSPQYSKTPELQHMARRTYDPAQRREKAIQFFSEMYFQNALEFSDTLTATFAPRSKGAASIQQASWCVLAFAAYSQEYKLQCTVKQLSREHPLYQATWWHNLLFNPDLDPESVVLAFEPDWKKSASNSK